MNIDKLRNYFYLFSKISAGFCLCLILLIIILQVIARLTGNVIPSSEDFAGWLLSATFFFGLATTFKNDGHIRMTVVLAKLSAKNKYYQELVNIAIGLIVSGYLAYYTAITVYESFSFGDVTDTYLALPLWIVQLPMAIGSLFLFIAMLDGLVGLLETKVLNFAKKNKA